MYGALADVVVLAHVAYLAFLVVGGYLAWRWWPVLWVHVAAAAWAAGIVLVGYDCPLTSLEEWLRERAGQAGGDGFIDRYVEDVIYPGALTPYLRVAVAIAIAVSWWGCARRRRRRAPMPGRPSLPGVRS
ncbi:MAG: DUF2784 domain-containing protein [Acidimicrobiia bacterium]